MEKLTKFDVAKEQLDWAIKLLIDHDSPIPAITLAGAAEEILGRGIGDEAVFNLAMKTLPKQLDLDPKIYSQQHLNKARNWLKHWRPEESDTIELDIKEEAIAQILRGIVNYIPYENAQPTELLRFSKWLANHSKNIC